MIKAKELDFASNAWHNGAFSYTIDGATEKEYKFDTQVS
jgi:hypothetical protein